ncbi:hypothetical protein CTEN210_09351 [Chaetoceros tenuissimus]|uniref:J domain-containing protein n=1 Tax=Chaetoceros tenuissimus TaxID=426638 RepID=A0AAD3CXN5_9STRA|nr:hypothetical protein CTEN210_09351 [Chaetoceros tenuissimus]
MSGNSRAGALASSQLVKKRLVKILFHKDNSRKGREAHKKLDYASYSYDDLRKAYIQKVQLLHPDTAKQTISSATEQKAYDNLNWRDVQDTIDQSKTSNDHDDFIELQEAWNAYEKNAKSMKKGMRDKAPSNFTMFGVGCSFSDSAEEQKLRADIMDQACRGWFTSGQIGEESLDESLPTKGKEAHSFSNVDNSFKDLFQDSTKNVEKNEVKIKTKTLIDHLIPRHKRR